jgi:signal transduction histidine kinase
MHDMLGHRLSLISVYAGGLELAAARLAPPMVEQAELLRTTAGTAMEELREILDVLRRDEAVPPSQAPPLASASTNHEAGGTRGTREDIAALVAESRRAGVAAELSWSGPDTAEEGARTRQALHRVIREGLTNVLKHTAGAPTRVEVTHTGQRIDVRVTNEAPNTARPRRAGNRSGLAGLEERITQIGGSFTAGPVGDGGFRIAAGLPSRNAPSHPQAAPSASPLAPPELPAEVLTWPRLLGAGCAAALVVLPSVAFVVFLLLTQVLR